jgi:hypothetical protein
MVDLRGALFVVVALASAATPGCSSNGPATPTPGSGESMDAALDSGDDDAPGPGTGVDATSDAGVDACNSTPYPITGTWKLTEIQCAYGPAPAGVQAIYSPPNKLEYVFDGAQVTGTVTEIAGCTLTAPLLYEYPLTGFVVISAAGPVACSPAACDPGCGTTGTAQPGYYYMESGCNQLVLVSSNDNGICANPVELTFAREE